MGTRLFGGRNYGAAAIAILSTFLFLFPIYWMVVTSLKPMSELFSSPPHLFPYEMTWKAYIDNFVKDQSIFKYIFNSAVISFGTLILTLLLATPFAYAMARYKLRGLSIILILLLTIQMLPSIMMAMPLFIVFSKLGLLNSFTSLIVANTTHTLPFAVLMLRPYFLAVPKGLEEAALIDGCNKFSAFWRVMVPCIKHGILTVGALCFLYAWGDFLFALIFTTDKSIHPLTMGLYKFITEYGAQWNNLMAVATISSLPIILIFIALQKHIVGGITSGAVKD
ncbi:carbohydrate ABC transporter permease [Ammoniphilus sp. 3BR4]|uniref:carbohydrate ABC transporter permease n=1 Tax=Ammoniphilus sp. 3BR4 TaxID=3158265 RepID=UPI003467805E